MPLVLQNACISLESPRKAGKSMGGMLSIIRDEGKHAADRDHGPSNISDIIEYSTARIIIPGMLRQSIIHPASPSRTYTTLDHPTLTATQSPMVHFLSSVGRMRGIYHQRASHTCQTASCNSRNTQKPRHFTKHKPGDNPFLEGVLLRGSRF